MPAWILFALASPREGFDPQLHKSALESNIRFCDFFLQIFGEAMPHPAFVGFVELAAACTADPAFPMRSTVVVFPESGAGQPRDRGAPPALIETGCEVHDFHNAKEFDELADEVLSHWFDSVKPLANSSRRKQDKASVRRLRCRATTLSPASIRHRWRKLRPRRLGIQLRSSLHRGDLGLCEVHAEMARHGCPDGFRQLIVVDQPPQPVKLVELQR